MMSQVLEHFYLPLLVALVCYVIYLIYRKYLGRETVKKLPREFRVLRYYSHSTPSRTLIISLVVVAAVNLLSSFVAILIDQVSPEQILSGRTLREVTLNAVVFGFFYYLGFGSLSFVIHHTVGEHNSLPLCVAQGHNSAFIAGGVVYPLQSIGYVASRVLAPVEPSNLYALELNTMTALYLHAVVTALCYGLLLGSLFLNVGRSDAPIVRIQRNQNWIILIILAIVVFGPAFAMWVNPGSLFAKSLMFKNVYIVWCVFIVVSAGSYVIGSWIFTKCLNQLLFSNIKNNKRKHSLSRKDEDRESQTE